MTRFTPAERDAVIRAVAASERLAGYAVSPELVARLLERLEQEEPEDAPTPSRTTTTPHAPPGQTRTAAGRLTPW